uniref:Mucin n=1 Tax=Rhipicephalus appendiculatus TaxID=34631 RepID=A0A131YJS6_RHIAP
MKVQAPAAKAGPAKRIPFEGELKGTSLQPVVPSFPTIQTLTPTVKPPAVLLKAPAAVQANEIATPALNVSPSTPRVLTQGVNQAMKIQAPSTMIEPTNSVSFMGGLKRITKPATIPSHPAIETLTPTVESTAVFPKTLSAVQASAITIPAINIPRSTPRLPTEGGNEEMKIEPPSTMVQPTKSVSVEGELKGTTESATAPSLPTIAKVTLAVKSEPELPNTPSGVQASDIITPILNVGLSTPKVRAHGRNVEMKVQPPSPKAGKTKSLSFEGELNKTRERAMTASLPRIEVLAAAVESVPEFPKTPSAAHANEITTPLINVTPSIPGVTAQEGNVVVEIHTPSPKVEETENVPSAGKLKRATGPAIGPSYPNVKTLLSPAVKSTAELPKTPSGAQANEITTFIFNVPPPTPRVPMHGGNVALKIHPPPPNLRQMKNVSFESGLNKPSAGLPNKVIIPKLNLPTSAPIVPRQGDNAAIKIQPPSPKIEQTKSVSFEGGLNTITKPTIVPSFGTIQRLTPSEKSPAELPRTPSTLHADITTPRLNSSPSAPIVPMRGFNVATKILPPSPMIQKPKSAISEGKLNRITELATTSSHPTMESSPLALKSAAQLPNTPSAMHAHKISTPVFNVPLLTPRVPKGGSNVATKIPPGSLKVEHKKSAPFEDMLRRTTEPALAPSLLKVEKLSPGGKFVAELAKQPSPHLVKGIITMGLNMRPSASKVLTLARSEGTKMRPPGESVAQTKGASFEVEPKRATEPAAGSSQSRKVGASISAVHLTKKASGRLVVKVNPMGSIFPPPIIPVFTKAGNAPKNMQPPGPNLLHPKNGSFEGELKGSKESTTGPSFNKAQSFMSVMKSEAEIPKERSALLKNEINYAGVTAPRLLGITGTEVIKVQPSTPNVSQPTLVSVAASLRRSASRIGNGLTEFDIETMHRKESKIVPEMPSHAANISREKAALALPTQDVSRELRATSNTPMNQPAIRNAIAELATNSLLLPLKKPVEGNLTALSAGPPLLTKNEVANKTHKQPSVSVLLQPTSKAINVSINSQAINVFAKSRLIPHAGPYAQHASYHTNNEGASNERLTSLKFLPDLAQITPLDVAPPNNADQGHLFEATLRAISHNIGSPIQTQSTFREMMKPVRGIPQLTTLIEQARSRNFMNTRFGAPEAKNSLLRRNILYNTEPLRERNGLENYALFGTRAIWPFQQPSSARSRTLLEERLGVMNSHKSFGLSPYLFKPQKPIQPPHFMYEHVRILPDRVPVFVKSNTHVLRRICEFLDIKKPDGWNGYSSNLINAQLPSRLYATLPYWHSATFELFLSQKVESNHDLIRRQKFMPFIPKAGPNVRGFFLPLSTPPTRVPLIPLRNLESRRTRDSHFLPKPDFESRYAHQRTAFAVLPHWHPKTFEHLLQEEVESGHDLVRRRDFAPSIRNSAEYVRGSISPPRAHFQYSTRDSPKATATSGPSGASRSPGRMNVESRKLYSSNLLERRPLLLLLYAMQSPWYPRTIEHVLSQEGKSRKGLQIKRIFFPFIKNDRNDMGAVTPPLSTYSEYMPRVHSRIFAERRSRIPNGLFDSR